MTCCAPDQRTASVQSATSAPTSSTSTCLSRSAKRCLTHRPAARRRARRARRRARRERADRRASSSAWTPPSTPNERERARLLDAYQAGLLDLDELTRRTSALTARHDQLAREKETLTQRSTELATQNRLRHRLAGFSERIAASLDDLDFEGRQRLLRLVVEKVRVTGWRVEIHLKIPLAERATTRRRPTRPPAIWPEPRPRGRQATVKRCAPAFRSCRSTGPATGCATTKHDSISYATASTNPETQHVARSTKWGILISNFQEFR